MYKCLIIKHIWRNLERTEFGARLQCEISLNFPPFVGLKYLHEDINFEFSDIQWRQTENLFFCMATDGGISGIGHDHFTFEELVENYKSEGWELRGIVKPGQFIEE